MSKHRIYQIQLCRMPRLNQLDENVLKLSVFKEYFKYYIVNTGPTRMDRKVVVIDKSSSFFLDN